MSLIAWRKLGQHCGRHGLMIAALAPAVGCAGTPTAPAQPLGYVTPLRFSYAHWDHHLLQWLPDHPRYEMAEALIDDTDPANVFFFMTEREAVKGSKKQYCYSNTQALAERLALGVGDRESRTVDIAYQRVTDSAVERYHVELDAVEGHVTWDFTPMDVTRPDYASGLVDAVDAGHDLRSGLLVFYLPESAVVDQRTQLSIAGDAFAAQPWTEISKPPYFEAYRGVHSRDVHNGYFGAMPPTRVEYLTWPSELQHGTRWQTRETTEEPPHVETISAESAEIEGDSVTVQEDWGFRYHVLRSAEGLQTKALSMLDGDKAMRIDFQPPLPDLRSFEVGPVDSSFSISFTGHDSVMKGQVSITKQATTGKLEVLLAPGEPEWAKQIRLRATIELTNNGYVYQSVSEYPQVGAP